MKNLLFFVAFLIPFLVQDKLSAEDVVLADGWKFIQQDVALTANVSAWESVKIPHTWNAFDGQDNVTKDHTATETNLWTPGPEVDLKAKVANPKQDYFRGPCWYVRSLDVPAPTKGKRVFLRFEAASSVAEVWLNGGRLGEHRGAFTAFCFELTPYLKADGHNDLRARVNNAYREDVPPISGDFNVSGGLYRPVHLITKNEVCISPLDSASSGVYLTTKSLDDTQAVVEARSVFSNGGPTPAEVTVETTVKDAAGKTVASVSGPLKLALGSGEIRQTLKIPSPHRWQGRNDPYLYTATVRVLRGKTEADSMVQPLGLRTVAITEEQGFLLNGKPYAIHGVNRHQDWRDKGWALSDADHDRDFQLMTDMGVTAVRLAHYPQATHVYDLADRLGLVVWHEVTLVDHIRGTPEFTANAELQLRELMLQHFNHPSIAFTGVFNEIRRQTAEAAIPLIQHLNDVAHEVNPGCITVAAPCIFGQAIDRIPDRIGFNVYPGWYSETPEDMTKNIDKSYDDVGGKRVALSEYGAGGNPDQHEEGDVKMPENRSHWHPEEWQNHVHERDWAQIQNSPKLWGSFLWVMFDFASDSRNEGAKPGVNDKGLVTQDRAVKKDVYFFYQANWAKQPMLHIVSSRMTPRKLATTEIKVYSNCTEVELKVNGKSLGTMKPDDVRVFRWENVALIPGKNRIEAVATSDGKSLAESCEWELTP